MAKQELDPNGTMWFFTRDDSPKMYEVARHREVNVSFASQDDNRYVSVTGTAVAVHDKAKAEELWNPLLKAWFPKGLEDPSLALLKITLQRAEYWDTPSSTMVQLFGFVKAVTTGQTYEPGEHQKINLERT